MARRGWVGAVLVLLIGAIVRPIPTASAAPAPPRSAPASPVGTAVLQWGDIGAPIPMPLPAVSTYPDLAPWQLPAGAPISSLAAGARSQCLLSSGQVYCWGDQSLLGRAGVTHPADVPVRVDTDGVLHGLTVTSIAVGGDHACALAAERIFCWGAQGHGQLGNGKLAGGSAQPVAVQLGALAGHHLTQLVAGRQHTCVLADKVPYCWGANRYGQVGNNTRSDQPVPVPVVTSGVLAGRAIAALAAGLDESCALASGWEYCWGYGPAASLNVANPDVDLVPASLYRTSAMAGKTLVQIGVGGASCAVATDNSMFCRGDTADGWSLGSEITDRTVTTYVPVPPTPDLAGRSITSLVDGPTHSCVLASGTPVCWGNGFDGEIGNDSVSDGSPPVAAMTNGALAGRSVLQIVVGGARTVVLATAAPAVGNVRTVPSARIYDSHAGGHLQPGASVAVPVAGLAGVPATGVASVAVEVSAVAHGVFFGNVIAAADGAPRPIASILSLSPNLTLANQAVIPLGADGSVRIWNNSPGVIDVMVDVTGYYLTGAALPGDFAPVVPTRLYDSHPTRLAPGAAVTVLVAGRAGVPAAGVGSAVVDVTAVAHGVFFGNVIAAADGTPEPITSVLSLSPNMTLTNLAVVALGGDGRIRLWNNSPGVVDLMVDVVGYHLAGTAAPGGFQTVPSTRLYDSHPTRIPAGGSVSVGVTGVTGLPVTGVSAASVTVTAVAHGVFFGNVIAGPDGDPRPVASVLSLSPNLTLANQAVVGVGGNGRIRFWNNSPGAIDLMIDLSGFVRSPRPGARMLYAWGLVDGRSVHAAPNLFSTLDNVSMVTASRVNGYLVRGADGEVWSWGLNDHGQLGVDGPTGTPDPIRVPRLPAITAVASSTGTAYAIGRDGTLWSWGWGGNGALGTGSLADSDVPTRVPGLTAVVAVAAGVRSGYALRADGTVWAWGRNDHGQLGTGDLADRSRPVVIATLAGVVALAAGNGTAYAVRADGTVWAWGRDDVGQLGHGTTVDSAVPVRVIGLSDAVDIAAGSVNAFVRTRNSYLFGWGSNVFNLLGPDSQAIPFASVPQYMGPLVTLMAGGQLTDYAVVQDGSLLARGNDELSQLGGPVSSLANTRTVPYLPGTPLGLATASDGLAQYAIES